jgi:hypothetical protein
LTQYVFKAGQSHNGYFTNDDTIKQAENAMDIFEQLTANTPAQGLFLFDNAPSHIKCTPDALTARKMPKCLIV